MFRIKLSIDPFAVGGFYIDIRYHYQMLNQQYEFVVLFLKQTDAI
jgi:hypothetical protein